jgi:hypothetical protein
VLHVRQKQAATWPCTLDPSIIEGERACKPLKSLASMPVAAMARREFVYVSQVVNKPIRQLYTSAPRTLKASYQLKRRLPPHHLITL